LALFEFRQSCQRRVAQVAVGVVQLLQQRLGDGGRIAVAEFLQRHATHRHVGRVEQR
jgi:hypothetical protein